RVVNSTSSCAKHSARSLKLNRAAVSSSTPTCRASRSPSRSGTSSRSGSIRRPRLSLLSAKSRIWRRKPMSPQSNDEPAAPHPRQTHALFGHTAAETTLLNAYRSGGLPHAFLIVGPKGIGKATLAYRTARFAMAHPDPAAPEVQKATSLAVDENGPVARRIAAQG